MSPRALAAAVALVCAAGAIASAKPAKSAAKSAAKAGKHKHGSPGHPADNMPPNWTWPPSRAMRASGAKCLAKLDELGVKWKRAPAEKKIATPIYVPAMELGGLKLTSIWRDGPFAMDCELALALAEHGPDLTAIGVRELQFSRIYGYTNVHVGGKTKNVLSRHALGLAIDVYVFVDADGVKHTVETDYPADDELLHQIEDTIDASGGFRLCLTPGNDPLSHHDHFHLEANVIYPVGAPPRVSARAAAPR